jgi:hypothetical protein
LLIHTHNSPFIHFSVAFNFYQMIKICPHCGNEFECKEEDIFNCDCLSVTLPPETRAYIASQYDDCLCVNCLWEFEKNEKATS